jgi:hypothetical protein
MAFRSLTAPPGLHAQALSGGVPDVRARELSVPLYTLMKVRFLAARVTTDTALQLAPLGVHARGAGRRHDVRAEELSTSFRSLGRSCISCPICPTVSVSLPSSTSFTKSTTCHLVLARRMTGGRLLPFPLLLVWLRLLIPPRPATRRRRMIVDITFAANPQVIAVSARCSTKTSVAT